MPDKYLPKNKKTRSIMFAFCDGAMVLAASFLALWVRFEPVSYTHLRILFCLEYLMSSPYSSWGSAVRMYTYEFSFIIIISRFPFSARKRMRLIAAQKKAAKDST